MILKNKIKKWILILNVIVFNDVNGIIVFYIIVVKVFIILIMINKKIVIIYLFWILIDNCNIFLCFI